MQWNAASDNTGESRKGVGVGSIERGAANGRCRRPDCSRRGLMVLKESVGGGSGVACVRVWCVCVVSVVSGVSVSALCLSPTCESLALSQAGWLATGRADV